MITNQVIQSSIDDLRAITRVDLCVFDDLGEQVASTIENPDIDKDMVVRFAASPADSQVIGMYHLLKIVEDGELQYVLVARGVSEDTYMVGKIAVSQIRSLVVAYKDRYDRGSFFQNLLMDNLLLVDVYSQARKFRIDVNSPRVIFLVENPGDTDGAAGEVLKGLFSNQAGDFVVTVDEQNLVVVKTLEGETSRQDLNSVAETIVDMLNTEIMVNVRVSYGTVVTELKDLSKSYKEAKMAMDVGKIFYAEKLVNSYSSLGIGRLIYQLPVNLCRLFIQEIFGDTPFVLDEETLNNLNIFFENNLNVSETSRKLFLHRNTLVYRIDKIKQAIGLDLKKFDEALTFKIAMMVLNYMNYLDSQK